MNSEDEEKPWRLRKTERGEEIQLIFEEERRRRTAACPNLPSLLFSSLSLPLPSLLWITAQGVGGAGRGEEIRVWRGVLACGYCSTWLLQRRPACLTAKNNITCSSKLQMRLVNSQTECTRRAIRNHSVCLSIRAMDKKYNFGYQLYAFPYRKRILPFVHFGCYILPSLKEFVPEFSITNAWLGKRTTYKQPITYQARRAPDISRVSVPLIPMWLPALTDQSIAPLCT